MNGQIQTRRQRLVPMLKRILFSFAAIFGCVLFFIPAPLRAANPVNVNTIVSRSGAEWNAPLFAQLFFPTYSPSLFSGQNTPPAIIPKTRLSRQLRIPLFPGSIIGQDGRTRVQDTKLFPYRAVVFLQLDYDLFYIECTGILIGPHTIATAGHCVRDPSLGWAQSARIYPGADAGAAPFGVANGVDFFSVSGWTDDYNPAFDYGAIELDRDIGDETGWLGMSVLDEKTLSHLTARVTGYPADKPNQTMWTMAGALKRVTPLRLFYAIDTYAGDSGAPIYNTYPSRACAYCVIGIHGYGVSGDPHDRFNSGVRVTSSVISNFVAWRNLP